MKWFLFFLYLTILLSCNLDENEQQLQDKKQPIKNKAAEQVKVAADDLYWLPIYSEKDSGYFKIGKVKKINTIYYQDSISDDASFLSRNLITKEILLKNRETLSHSVSIDHTKMVRLDTLTNGKTTIFSVYKFGEKESQKIIIDGTIARNYKWNGVDSLQEDIFNLDGGSFRYFTFKGNEFYYITAGIMDCYGGSACLTEYQLIYDIKQKSLNIFSNFRVAYSHLLGDIDNDNNLDFLEIENDGGYGVSEINHFSIKIYSNTKSGNFELLKDKYGKAYFLDGNSGTDYYVGSSFNIEKYSWPVKLK